MAQKPKVEVGDSFQFSRSDKTLMRFSKKGDRILWDNGDDKHFVPWMDEASFRQYVDLTADCLGCRTSSTLRTGNHDGNILVITLTSF